MSRKLIFSKTVDKVIRKKVYPRIKYWGEVLECIEVEITKNESRGVGIREQGSKERIESQIVKEEFSRIGLGGSIDIEDISER
jgi:hypothetical protein